MARRSVASTALTYVAHWLSTEVPAAARRAVRTGADRMGIAPLPEWTQQAVRALIHEVGDDADLAAEIAHRLPTTEPLRDVLGDEPLPGLRARIDVGLRLRAFESRGKAVTPAAVIAIAGFESVDVPDEDRFAALRERWRRQLQRYDDAFIKDLAKAPRQDS